MKKYLYLLPLLVVIIASSCNKKDKDLSFTMSFKQESYPLNENESQNLLSQLVIEPESADTVTVVWSSSNSDVVEVSSSGYVTAFVEGSATITATSHGKTASCEVKVLPLLVTSYKLASTVNDVFLGEEVEIPITDVSPSGASLSRFTWTSSNASCEPYYQKGKWYVKADVYGTLKLTAHYEGLADQTCSIPVNVNRILSITVSPQKPAMLFNSEKQLTTIITKQDQNRPLTYSEDFVWSSDDETIATVDQTGKIFSKAKEGSCKITCKHKAAGLGDKEVSAYTTVSVTKQDPITAFSLDKTSLEMQVSSSSTITVSSITPSTTSASYINWSSSSDLVSLSVNGKVCTVVAKNKVGNCEIYAEVNGIRKVVPVTVKPIEIKSVKITTIGGTMFSDGSKYVLNFDVTPSNATINSVSVEIKGLGANEYTVSTDVNKKNVTLSFPQNLSKSVMQLAITLNVSDGVNTRSFTLSQFYLVPTNWYDNNVDYKTKNVYGTSGMSDNIKALPDVTNHSSMITDISVSHNNAPAVRCSGLKPGEFPKENKDRLLLYFMDGKIGNELYTKISFNYAVVDMNNKVLKSSSRSIISYRNRLLKYQFVEKSNGATINKKDISNHDKIIVTPMTDKKTGNKYYNAAYISSIYWANYMEGSGEEKTSTTRWYEDYNYNLYNEQAGKTKDYTVGYDSYEEGINIDENTPIFYLYFDK